MEYDSVSYNEVWQIRYTHSPYNKKRTKAKWEVFGTIFNFGFDPLEFSKKLGKYSAHS